jgi:hypothetical protein
MMTLKNVLITFLGVVILSIDLGAAPAQGSTNLIMDGSFEELGKKMKIGSYGVFPLQMVQNGINPVVGWQTTAPDHQMEIWKSGFQGILAPSGCQYFAELNANKIASDFQVVRLTEEAPVSYTLAHRGRLGADVMKLTIWGLGTNTMWRPGAPFAVQLYTKTMTDSNKAWGYYGNTNLFFPRKGEYYAFVFESVRAAGGNQSIGNFISDIRFGYNVSHDMENRLGRFLFSGGTLLLLLLLCLLYRYLNLGKKLGK